jgi:hypothetical protein
MPGIVVEPLIQKSDELGGCARVVRAFDVREPRSDFRGSVACCARCASALISRSEDDYFTAQRATSLAE